MLMRSLLFLLLSFGCSIYLPAREYDRLPAATTRAAFGFKGAVLQVTEKEWTPPSDSLIPLSAGPVMPGPAYQLQRSQAWRFDTTGHIFSINRSDPDERKRKAMKESGDLYYYRQGRLIAVATAENGKPADSVAYRYLKNGLMDDYQVFDGKEALQYKFTYAYRNGRLSLLRKKDKENLVIAMTKYKYDGAQLAETQHFDANLRLAETRRYSRKQADDGLQESYAVTDAAGKMKEGASWITDNQGRLQERNKINSNREVTEFHSYQYGPQDDPMAEKIFGYQEEATIVHRYTYDEQQNWTKRETFYNGLLQTVTVRELQYGH